MIINFLLINNKNNNIIMSTDLFNNYYNNPRKQAIYTNMICPGASSDDELSFSINNGAGEITNNKDVLASIDMSKIESNLREWNTMNKIIPAKSVLYIKGESSGESYKRIVFGKILNDVLDKTFNNYLRLSFNLKYLKDDNLPCNTNIFIVGYSINDIIDKLNTKLNEMKLHIHVNLISFNNDINNLISFESTKLGYNFYIDNISLYIATSNEIDDWVDDKNYNEIPLEEAVDLYIPHKKYINGALKGLVVIPQYPKYNNNISDANKSLCVTHIKDRVNVYVKHDDCYKKYQFDVFGDLSLKQEYDNCLLLHNNHFSEQDLDDNWLNDEYSDNIILTSDNEKIISNKVLGLYGYCNYATINDLWTEFGDFYSVISAVDIENESHKNYNNGIIIYNPNNFDIKLNILTWN